MFIVFEAMRQISVGRILGYNNQMNYLAHTLLSKKHIDYQIANLAADVMKGKAWQGCSSHHQDGLAMHKVIDSFTDTNAHVRQAKARLGRGYLKGVVLDITFDHFVAKHWSRYVIVEFEGFVSQFHAASLEAIDPVPSTLQQFIQRAVKYQFLRQYSDFSSLQTVLERFNQRLSEKILAKESATDYFPRLAEQYEAIERDFLLFFPELVAVFLDKSQATPSEHYLKVNS